MRCKKARCIPSPREPEKQIKACLVNTSDAFGLGQKQDLSFDWIFAQLSLSTYHATTLELCKLVKLPEYSSKQRQCCPILSFNIMYDHLDRLEHRPCSAA